MNKIVICEKCGAMVKVLIDCTCKNCGIKCCNEPMKEISEEESKKYLEKQIMNYNKNTHVQACVFFVKLNKNMSTSFLLWNSKNRCLTDIPKQLECRAS